MFEKNYKLKSIEELADYIRIHNRLPDIPTSDEVKKDGIDLGEMQTKLLQKIEELTLYVIQLKKESENFKTELIKIKNGTKK